MKKTEKVFCSICLAILMFFFCAIVIRALTRQILVKHFGMNNAFTDFVFFDARFLNDGENTSAAEIGDEFGQNSTQVDIDWSELYPFPKEYYAQNAEDAYINNSSEAPAAGLVSKPPSVLAAELAAKHAGEPVQMNINIEKNENNRASDFFSFRQYVAEGVRQYEEFWQWTLKEKIDDYTSDYLIGYQTMTELAKQYEDILRWNYVSYAEYNGIVETEDGYLTTVTSKRDMQEYADNTMLLSDFCTSHGIDFLYVNAPVKICRITDSELSGVSDFSNQNADDFLAKLKSADIDCYDLRIPLHDEGHDHHAMFFKTDNHWKPETGLWAAGKIISVLNAEYSFEIDPAYVNEDRYTAEVYPEWFLGAQGKKVTLAHADPEDFTLLYPAFEALLHYEVKSENINSDGDFSITYDMDCVTVKNYYRKNPYAAYIHGNQALEKIENKSCDNGHHVLIVHDSFGNCVVPFLAMGIQYVDSIDLRHFDGSLQTYIETEHPDCVVVMYNSEMLGQSITGRVFDFR